MLRLFLFNTLVLSSLTTSKAVPSLNPPSLVRREAPPQSTACGDIVRNASENTFKASLVNECLNSVPFNPAVATKFLNYYRDSVQFHSTLEYLKSPPESYRQPAFDLVGYLDFIQGQIETNQFANQYQFEAELQSAIYATHDDHLSLSAGILGVFSFGTSYRIATVSRDGIELPKVYLTADLILSSDGSFEPSPIVKLDGKDVVEYLTDFAARNSIGGREGHADWNQLMINPAQVIQSIPSVWGGGATFYPGETLTIELENKTKIETPWYGIFHGDSETGPLETGGDFYNSFVLGFLPASHFLTAENETEIVDEESAPTTSSSATAPPTPTETGDPPRWSNAAYPVPDLAQADLGTYGGGTLSAYYLKKPSIAVLSVPSFQEWGDAVDTYSAFVTMFIEETKKRGVKKVVIDLQRNYGGDALLAYDMFKQFFPSKDPYAVSRLRAHNSANIIGSTLTEYWQDLSDEYSDYYYLYSNEWVAPTRINAETDRNFETWNEFYGPHKFNGGNFTTNQRYNLSDELFDTLATGAVNEGFVVYGFGSRPENTTQAFAAEDIILLTDGICSSTCSLFVEMMHHEAGVRTVVAGGRPQYGPMQAVGLSRGANSYDIVNQLDGDIDDTQVILNYLNKSSNFLPNRTDALDVEVYYASINLRDQIRKGDPTPLQFKYDAADCRIFFTPKTIFNYTLLWQHAASAAWTRPELCVKDSTGYATSASNETKLPPADVLPPTPHLEAPPVKLGSLINSFLDPHSSIQAAPKPKGSTSRASANVASAVGKDCTLDPGDSSTCPPNFYCDRNYQFCSKSSPGKKIPRPGCVKRCQHSGRDMKCVGGGGTCRALPEDTANQLDNTGRGFCSADEKEARVSCTSRANVSVRPGAAGRPGKRELE